MVLCPALLGAPDFLQEGKKQSRLLIPGDGLEQRGSAEAAKALRQQNDGKYAPTREWKPLGRCPCTAWLCLPAGKLVLWFICPMQIKLLPAEPEQESWDGVFPTTKGVEKLRRREKKQLAEGHSANQGQENLVSWLLARACPQVLGVSVRSW